MQCAGSCRGGAPNQAMHAKFYAFSHTGTARNVVMVSSANLNKGGATLGYNDMFTMRGVPATFALYERVHAEMARDRVAGDPYRVLQEGRFLTRIFPKRGASQGSDPTFQTLKSVRCAGATGSAGATGARPSASRCSTGAATAASTWPGSWWGSTGPAASSR